MHHCPIFRSKLSEKDMAADIDMQLAEKKTVKSFPFFFLNHSYIASRLLGDISNVTMAESGF